MSVNENPNGHFFTKKYTKEARRFKRKTANKVKWEKEEEKMRNFQEEFKKESKNG